MATSCWLREEGDTSRDCNSATAIVRDGPIGQDVIQGFFTGVQAHDQVGAILGINLDGRNEGVQ